MIEPKLHKKILIIFLVAVSLEIRLQSFRLVCDTMVMVPDYLFQKLKREY